MKKNSLERFFVWLKSHKSLIVLALTGSLLLGILADSALLAGKGLRFVCNTIPLSWADAWSPPCLPKRGPVEPVGRPLDAVAIARQQLRTSGYGDDNTGYIRAVARGADELALFRQLRIRGDAEALKAVLSGTDFEAVEFANLTTFMAKVHSEHYAAPAREQLRRALRQMQASKSLDNLRPSSCASAGSSLIEMLAQYNLRSVCADDSQWRDRAYRFSLRLARFLDEDNLDWWRANEALLRKLPTQRVVQSDAPEAGKASPTKARPVADVAALAPPVVAAPSPLARKAEPKKCDARIGERHNGPLTVRKGTLLCSQAEPPETAEILEITSTTVFYSVNGVPHAPCRFSHESCGFPWSNGQVRIQFTARLRLDTAQSDSPVAVLVPVR